MERQGQELNKTKISPTTATTLVSQEKKNPPNHHSRTHRPFSFFGFPNFAHVLSVLEFFPVFLFSPELKILCLFEFRKIFPVFVCFWIDKQCPIFFFFLVFAAILLAQAKSLYPQPHTHSHLKNTAFPFEIEADKPK